MKSGAVDPGLNNFICNRSAGNPLFMEEFIHTLIENGSISKQGERFILSKEEFDIKVPDTIQGIIASRLDRLDDRLKRTMQVASVIGRDFAFRILQTISGVQEELKSYLHNLQKLEFIYEKNLFPELEYIFRHVLIQEVTYNSLLLQRRIEIHERIGKAIEELYKDRIEEFYEILAHHYSNSKDINKACIYLKLSGDKASKSFSTLEAYKFYREAAKLLRKQPDNSEVRVSRLDLLQLIPRLAAILGFPDDSIELMQEGEELAKEMGDAKALAHFQTTIGIYYLTSVGDSEKGRSYMERGLEEADLTGETNLIIPATTQLIYSSSFQGEYSSLCKIASKTIALIENVEAEYERFGNPYNIYSVLNAMYGMSLAITGNFKDGRALLEKGRSFALDLNDPLSLSIIEQSFSRYYWELGEGESMIEHSRSCIDYVEVSKFLMLAGLAWATLGYGYFFQSKFEKAKKYIEKGITINNSNGMSSYLGFMHYALGEIHFELGNYEKAINFSKEALSFCQKNNEKDHKAYASINLGRILGMDSQMKFEKAEELIIQGNDQLRDLGQMPRFAIGLLRLGELHAKMGQEKKALEHLKVAKSICLEKGMDYWLTKTQEALNQV